MADQTTEVVVIEKDGAVVVNVTDRPPVEVIHIGNLGAGPGPKGPPGNDAKWVSMTQAAFNALPVKDPNTLYVILN